MESPWQLAAMAVRLMTILSFILGSGMATLAGDEPNPIKHFSDLTGRTARRYGEDLEVRLTRYAQKTGYSIHIVITDKETLEDLAREYFRTNDMEAYGSNASIVVVASPKMRRIDIASSENFRGKFDNRNVRRQLDFKFRHQISSSPRFIEGLLQAIVEILDPWFYELDPPKFQTVNGPSLAHSPTGEVVMFLLAPILGVFLGIPLMAFTRAGGMGPWARGMLCGSLASLVAALVAMVVVRQPGGLVPGMLYYTIGTSFGTSTAVGVLKSYWFPDHYRGRRPNEPGPLYFRWG